MKTVKGSARNIKDHGEMSAALAKWFTFLAARAQGWTSDAPRSGQRAGEVSRVKKGGSGGAGSRGGPGSSPKKLPKSAAASAERATAGLSRAAEQAAKLMEEQKAKEVARAAAKKADREEAREKERIAARRKQQRSPANGGRSSPLDPGAAAGVSEEQQERFRARMAKLPNAVPKVGAIPKIAKKAPAATAAGGARRDQELLQWNGEDVTCVSCNDPILARRAGQGGMVDGCAFSTFFTSNPLDAQFIVRIPFGVFLTIQMLTTGRLCAGRACRRRRGMRGTRGSRRITLPQAPTAYRLAEAGPAHALALAARLEPRRTEARGRCRTAAHASSSGGGTAGTAIAAGSSTDQRTGLSLGRLLRGNGRSHTTRPVRTRTRSNRGSSRRRLRSGPLSRPPPRKEAPRRRRQVVASPRSQASNRRTTCLTRIGHKTRGSQSTLQR